MGRHHVLAGVGLKEDGRRHVLGVWHRASENREPGAQMRKASQTPETRGRQPSTANGAPPRPKPTLQNASVDLSCCTGFMRCRPAVEQGQPSGAHAHSFGADCVGSGAPESHYPSLLQLHSFESVDKEITIGTAQRFWLALLMAANIAMYGSLRGDLDECREEALALFEWAAPLYGEEVAIIMMEKYFKLCMQEPE
jgi:hypothetical protein